MGYNVGDYIMLFMSTQRRGLLCQISNVDSNSVFTMCPVFEKNTEPFNISYAQIQNFISR